MLGGGLFVTLIDAKRIFIENEYYKVEDYNVL